MEDSGGHPLQDKHVRSPSHPEGCQKLTGRLWRRIHYDHRRQSSHNTRYIV